jgi:ankyrin repeat protein
MLATAQPPFPGYHAASLLVAHPGVNISLTNALGKTVLHYAAEFGALDIVEACCAAKPDMLNVGDTTGLTPWLLAARGGQVDVVELMLQKPQLRTDARDRVGVFIWTLPNLLFCVPMVNGIVLPCCSSLTWQLHVHQFVSIVQEG